MNKLLIAIIEDDQDDRDFICSAMNENPENAEVITFSGGNDFFKYVNSGSKLPGLVITDLRMPVVTGFDVIKKIKDGERTKDINVVVLSTSGNKEDVQRAKDLGAAGYFVKPYTINGYSEIGKKITGGLGKEFLSFTAMLENFLKTFTALLPV